MTDRDSTDFCPECDAEYVDEDALYCHACGSKRGAGPFPYTVILLYPDYLANQYGEEYYFAWVKARSPKRAPVLARKQVANNLGDRVQNPDDFLCVAVYAGHAPCLHTEACNG